MAGPLYVARPLQVLVISHDRAPNLIGGLIVDGVMHPVDPQQTPCIGTASSSTRPLDAAANRRLDSRGLLPPRCSSCTA
ncbi:hypothetical protein GCM10023160_19070 [Brachybacterium paraconglomeratum]